MNQNRRLTIIIAGAILLSLLVYAIIFITDKQYRVQIPQIPVTASIPEPLKNQLTNRSRRAYMFTTSGNLGNLGMAYHSASDYEKAALCYKLATEKNKNEWIWHYYLGYLSLELGELNSSAQLFNYVIKKDPLNYMALYYASETNQKLGLNELAETGFRKIINADPPYNNQHKDRQSSFTLKTYSSYQLSRIYISKNQLDSAEIWLKSLIANEPSFGPAYRSLSDIYNRKKQPSLASYYTVRANDHTDYIPPADPLIDEISLISRSDEYLLKQIEDAIRSNNYKWALRLCNLAVEYYPENKFILSHAVEENFWHNNDKEALSYIDKHFELFSNDPKELMDIADILYYHKHLDQALRYFRQARKLLPKNSGLAIWLYDRGKRVEADSMMNEMVRNYPEDPAIMTDQIRLLLKKENMPLAEEYLAKLTKLIPTKPEVFELKGLVAEKNLDTTQALLMYEKALNENPRNIPLTIDVGNIYIEQKNWQQVYLLYNRGLVTDPNEPSLLEAMGRLLIACPDSSIKNISNGIDYTERAFISYKSSHDTRLAAGKTLATVYVSLGEKKKALYYINKTISLAKEKKREEEYTAYFKSMVSSK